MKNLSIGQRKLIFWIIMIVISSLLFYLWIKDVQRKLSIFKQERGEILQNIIPDSSTSSTQQEIKEIIEESKEINDNLRKLLNGDSTTSIWVTSSTSTASSTSTTTTSSTLESFYNK